MLFFKHGIWYAICKKEIDMQSLLASIEYENANFFKVKGYFTKGTSWKKLEQKKWPFFSIYWPKNKKREIKATNIVENETK